MLSLATSALIAAGASTALPRSTPEEMNVDPAGILTFVEALEKQDLETHGFMLVRDGRVIAEGWWKPNARKDKHVLYSLSKSFMSTALGLAVARGKLSVDDRVSKFFPEDMPSKVDPNLAEMRVKDLLSMVCGHDSEPSSLFGAKDPARAFLAHPVPHKPGTHFLYNTAGSYMLSAVVQKATGQTLTQILKPAVYEPLGIEGVRWDQGPAGVDFGGFGLHASTEDIAKFGLLYLQKGVWEGKRVLPEGWAEAATSRQVANGTDANSDWSQGYGYQFWRCRNDAYRGDGAFGQFCIVMPKQKAVLAITGGGGDMQKTLNAVWTHLLPAFDRKPAGRVALARKLKSLELPYPKGMTTTEAAAQVNGRTYRAAAAAAPIPSLRFDFLGDTAKMTWPGGSVAIGLKGWKKGRSALFGEQPQAVLARGAWTAEKTFCAKVVGQADTWSATFTAKFDGDKLTVTRTNRGTFGPAEGRKFEGKAGQ